MKKSLFAGLLALSLFTPAFGQNTSVADSPDEPLEYPAIVACIAVLMALRLAKPIQLTRQPIYQLDGGA